MDDRPVSLPDPDMLTPIEEEFWTGDGAMPPGASLAVRGAPISAEKFLAHAVGQAREFSLRGANMASVSVDLVLADWPLERILANQLATYTRYGTCRVDDLEGRGFEVFGDGSPATRRHRAPGAQYRGGWPVERSVCRTRTTKPAEA
jgi:hypothetical protein